MINDFDKQDQDYAQQLRLVLQKAGLRFIPVPYNPYQNRNMMQATGIYLNYLQMKNGIILPTFGIPEDEKVVRLFENLFPDEIIEMIGSNVIAEQGGVLNCITWNIFQNSPC